jgi:hypothetical protein
MEASNTGTKLASDANNPKLRSSFGYPPLDSSTSQIRLIHLDPCTTGTNSPDTITCSLHVASLDDRRCKYEALSYEWGDTTTMTRPIFLNGTTFLVGQNLWSALWHLRDETEERIFWIDAICINQKDGNERNHQVQQMGRIYERAHCVVAWLGDEMENRDGSKGLARFFQDLEFHDNISMIPDYGQGVPPYLKDNGNYQLIREALRHLCFDVTYWKRLWILQELILASDIVVQAGRLKFRWYGFEKLFDRSYRTIDIDSAPSWYQSLYTQARDSATSSRPSLIHQQRVTRRSVKDEPPHLLSIAFEFSSAQCQDIRDKIFGLHSLTRECCQNAIAVDYKHSPAEICQEMLIHHLRSHRIVRSGSNIEATHVDMSKAEKILGLTRTVHAPLLTTGRESGSMARLACTPMGRIDSFVEMPSIEYYRVSHKRSRLDFHTYEAINDGGDIGSTLFALAASKKNPALNWLAAQLPMFTTNTGFSGKTLFKMQAGDLVYRFKSLKGAFILRSEEKGLRLVGVATCSPGFGDQDPALGETDNKGALYMDIEALLAWEKIFHWESGCPERRYLTDVWPRWFTDHTARDITYLVPISTCLPRVNFIPDTKT